jgi:Flp pilus assembly protein TadD
MLIVAQKKKKKRSLLSQMPRTPSSAAAASAAPVAPEPSLAGVKELVLLERREDALNMLAALPDSTAGDAPLLEELGRMLMDRQDFDGASALHRRWVQAAPQSARAYNSLGASLVSGGWLDAGLKTLQSAVSLDPDNYIYYFNLTKLYMVRGQWEEAKAMLNSITHRFPEHKDKIEGLRTQFPDDLGAS